jgi:hypothetical protein
MSIANLFAPNDYNLFCTSITPSVVPPSILTDDIDTIGIGDTLTIGTVRAGDIIMSQFGQQVVINGLLVGLKAQIDIIDALGTLNLGPTATTIVIGGTAFNIIVQDGSQFLVQTIDHVTNAALYNSCPFVTAGAAGGTFQFNGGISFTNSGPPQLNYFNEDIQFGVMGSGPFPIQPIGHYSAQRTNNMVTFNFTWVGPSVVATAAALIQVTPILPAAFIPASRTRLVCQVQVNGVLTVGTISFTNTGTIKIFPSIAGVWNIGESVLIDSIAASWNILL